MAAPYYGDFPVNGVVSFLWNTNDQTGASITRATDGTLKIFKTNANTATWQTERSSLSGVTQVEDFEATGIHAVRIDLSDNTDAGFYAAGNEYQVAYTGMTIDGKTVNAAVAHFSIERAIPLSAIYRGSVTGAATTTTLIDSGLTAADTDHYKGRIGGFLSGNLKHQATDITAFDPALDKITFTAVTQAPASGDRHTIV